MGKLKATIALLPGLELSNEVSAAALLVHSATAGRLRWPRLPPHLSLKQPFAFESLPALERYFDQLANELGSVRVVLRAVEVHPPSPGSPEAVVWVGVEDEPVLRELHRRINRELSTVVADAGAPFDGDLYRFHMTLGFLPAQSLAPVDALPRFSGTTATFHELGLFVYDGLPGAGWQTMLYARRSLSAAPSP